MSDWIYCGDGQQAAAEGTQSLLRSHQAIWCSPPGLRRWPGTPVQGERVWVIWRAPNAESGVLLGGGILLNAPRSLYRTKILWTDPDLPGVRSEAMVHGYSGPTSMSFLRLSSVVLQGKPFLSAQGLGDLSGGLNIATAKQVGLLDEALPIHRDA